MLRFALTGTVHLRHLESCDAEEMYALVVANRDHLLPWMPWAADQDLERTKAFIAMGRKQLADNNGFQVAMVEDGRIIGALGFDDVDWENRSAGIGYWIDQGHEGRGLVTRAVRAMIDHAFGVWGMHRIEIQAAPGNARSQAIPLRLGFTREGMLRESERSGDGWLDGVVFGLLASEWPLDAA
jgi:ribosomal-protein-serine acetyltransferase